MLTGPKWPGLRLHGRVSGPGSTYHLIPGPPVEEGRSDVPANSEGLVRQPGSGSGERTFANAASFQVDSGGASDSVTTEAR